MRCLLVLPWAEICLFSDRCSMLISTLLGVHQTKLPQVASVPSLSAQDPLLFADDREYKREEKGPVLVGTISLGSQLDLPNETLPTEDVLDLYMVQDCYGATNLFILEPCRAA